MRGERARYFLLRKRRIAVRILGASARIEQLFLTRLELTPALIVTMRRTTSRDLDVLRPLAGGSLFGLQTLRLGAQTLCLYAPFRFARQKLRSDGLELAQRSEDGVEVRARLGE